MLGPLRSVDRDRLIAEYAQLDRAIVKDAAHRVMAAANARRPNAILGAAAILQREAQKKRATCRSRPCSPRPGRWPSDQAVLHDEPAVGRQFLPPRCASTS